MRTSERELLSLATAAALGMGYPHGVCEDLAKAVVWLVQRGADGLGALAASTPRGGEPLAARIEPVAIDAVHAGSDGPGLLGLLLAAHSPDEHGAADVQIALLLTGLDSPLLLVGLCGAVANATGTNLELQMGETGASASPAVLVSALVAGAGSRGAGGSIVGGNPEELSGTVEISCRVSVSGPEHEAAPPIRLVVPDRRWAEAESLALRTYVPASEQSRHSGAGAGLTDND